MTLVRHHTRTVMLALGSILIGFGIPLAWVWIGSFLQKGLDPSFSALVVVLLGIALSYAALALGIGWVNARHGEGDAPTRYAWNRSMRDARHSVERTKNGLEAMVIGSVVVVAIVCTIWFFFFGDPGVRPGS